MGMVKILNGQKSNFMSAAVSQDISQISNNKKYAV
jgi:hypothetical protein